MQRPGFFDLEPFSHRLALWGRVFDRLTLVPLPGAEVIIVTGPPLWTRRVESRAARGQRPDRCLCDAAGTFRFLDLPDGDYELRAKVANPRYGVTAGAITLPGPQVASLELSLPPTALVGVVRAHAPAGPLAMARVRLLESGETAYTSVDGSYTLAPLEAGTNRRIEISAQRYAATTQVVTLVAGQTTSAPVVTLLQA